MDDLRMMENGVNETFMRGIGNPAVDRVYPALSIDWTLLSTRSNQFKEVLRLRVKIERVRSIDPLLAPEII